MSRQGGPARFGVGVSGVAVVLGVGAYAAFHALRLREPPRALAAAGAPPALPVTPTRLRPDELFRRACPAVVRVNVSDAGGVVLGHGTGFFVSADGLVVTSLHVIGGADVVSVQRSEGAVLPVQGVAAVDAGADLVVLRVDGGGAALPTLSLGPDEPPAVGTAVYAIGHPLGLRNVLSEGLVSGLGDPARGQHFIQTTAAAGPGSSGGPLMTADGAVVGVTTATVREAQNMNFAMPAARLRWLLGRTNAGVLTPLAAVTRPSAATAPTSAKVDEPIDRALDRVWDAVRQGRLDDAARRVGELRAAGASSAYYWFTAGCVGMKRRDDDAAAEAFRRSLRINPDKVATYLNLGQVYARQGKLREALAAYASAAKVDPGDARIYAQAGDACARLGERRRAASFYRKAAQLDPRRYGGNRQQAS